MKMLALSLLASILSNAVEPVVELDTVLHPDCQLDSGRVLDSIARELSGARVVSRFGDGLTAEHTDYLYLNVKGRPGHGGCAVAVLVAEASRDYPNALATYRSPYLEVFTVEVGDSPRVGEVAAMVAGVALDLTAAPNPETRSR